MEFGQIARIDFEAHILIRNALFAPHAHAHGCSPLKAKIRNILWAQVNVARRADGRIDRHRALGADKRDGLGPCEISRIAHWRINPEKNRVCSGEFDLIVAAAGAENTHALNRTQPRADHGNDLLGCKRAGLVEFAVGR